MVELALPKPCVEQAPPTARAGRTLQCLHLITDLELGGAELMLYKVLARMDRGRFCHTVVSLDGPGPVGVRIQALGIAVHTLHLRQPGRVGRGLGHLLAILRRHKPDLLQTWLYHADLIGLIAGRVSRVPRIVWNIRRVAPAAEDRPGVGRLAWLNANLARFVDRIIVNSEAGRLAHVRLGFPADKMVVIPNGFDLAQFSPDPARRRSLRAEQGIPQEALVIGTVARWASIKGYQTFFQAAAQLAGRHPDVWFALAGNGMDHDNQQLRAAITAAGIEGRTILLGVQEDPRRLYHLCDLFTLASHAEGFPNVVGEAMACGLPCVVTDVGDAATLVGPTGRVVDPRNPDALAQAWEAVLTMEPGARERLGQMARQRIAQHYDIADAAKRMEALYLTLAAS